MHNDLDARSHIYSQRMELLVFAIVLTLTGAQKSQLEGPQNALSVVGSNITLKCSSPSRNCSGIDWLKYTSGGSPVTVFKGPRTILNTVDKDRYSVDNSSGCDLVIRNVQLTDTGRFICSAIIGPNQVVKSAYLITLKTHPMCTLDASLHDVVEGDVVQLKCEVTYMYNGTNRIGLSMNWKGVTDAPAAVKNVNTISRYHSAVASAPEVPSFTCETSFSIETGDDYYYGRFPDLATNSIPNASCSTSAIKVLYSVINVTLSPSLSKYPLGTVITCMAEGHPPPTLKWQEKDPCGVWMAVQNCSTFSVTDVSSKQYRCVAMNVVRGKSHSAISPEIQFSSTDYLSATAISASDYRLGLHTGVGIGIGIGVGIGFIVAIILASTAFAMLVRHKYLELHPNPATDRLAQHQEHEMSPASHQRSARKRAPLVGEQESTYAGLGEDRDANEYASLEQK